MGKFFKATIVIALLSLVGGGTAWYISHTSHLLRIENFTINPRVDLNPSRQYQLVLWEHELPLPWNPDGQNQSLKEAIQEFQSIYPNIDVEVRWIAWDEGQQELRESLAHGSPPDIYGMPHGVRQLDHVLQIPIDPYLSTEAEEDVMDSALVAVREDSRMWAWPKWISPTFWVAHRDSALDLDHSRTIWDFDRFIEAGTAAKQKTGTWGIVLNPMDPSLFVAVMTASTGSNIFGPSGERAWSVEDMTKVLEFFHTLVASGITDSNIDRMSRSRLARFLNDEALMIAPVNLWLYRHLLIRTDGQSDSKIVTLPPPASSGSAKVYPATIGGYTVFRQTEYKGDDHTKAAMLLAQHLSRRLGPWEAAQLLAVPAHPTAWETWRDEVELPETEADFLIELASHSLGGPLKDTLAHQQQKIIHQVIADEFPKVWQKVPPGEIAESIARKIDGVRAEVPILPHR